ncbi:hypothetical protein SKAU_G00030270 [Synaphobranchus kaupii]|uniref:Uncharacterized protein n=1 Tax=Synaphobranchus kaupii TaxID=118154 RepID=A0A9Q1GDN6_SYNKA|nr:hypothetical protein SKAU_G00030270 [Synaphobranchus kaupii]
MNRVRAGSAGGAVTAFPQCPLLEPARSCEALLQTTVCSCLLNDSGHSSPELKSGELGGGRGRVADLLGASSTTPICTRGGELNEQGGSQYLCENHLTHRLQPHRQDPVCG